MPYYIKHIDEKEQAELFKFDIPGKFTGEIPIVFNPKDLNHGASGSAALGIAEAKSENILKKKVLIYWKKRINNIVK